MARIPCVNPRGKLLVVGVNVALCALLVEGVSVVALRALSGQWTSRRTYLAEVLGQAGDPGPAEGGAATGAGPGAVAGPVALSGQATPQWILQPYFGFARNPEARDVPMVAGIPVRVPVNEHGLFGPSPLLARSDDTFHVALAGGSVALELYLYSRDALIAELARLPGAAGKRIEVVCLALGGVKQPQQLLQLNYFLALGAQYDLVINLDGFNEVALPMAENRPRGVNPFYPRNWIVYSDAAVDLGAAIVVGRLADLRAERQSSTGRLAANPLRRSYTGLVVHELRRRRLNGRIYRLEQELRALMSADTLGPQQRGPAYPVKNRNRALADLVDLWQRASLQMWALSQGSDIPYYHFLQPNQYVRDSKPFSPWELQHAINIHADYARAAIPGYPLLIAAGRELADRGAPFVDLTELYADEPRTVYKDHCCHFNEAGGEILAREIGRRIVSAAAPPRATLERQQ